MNSPRAWLAACMLGVMTASGQTAINQGVEPTPSGVLRIREGTSTRLPVFTLEGWIKDSSRVVIASRDLPSAHGSDWSLVYNWTNQCLEFMSQKDAGPDLYLYSSANSLIPNVWQHIAIVVNGPAGTIRGYVNGSPVMDATFPARSFDANVGLSFGGYGGGGGGGWGKMDELRYWNIERSEVQIRAAKDAPLRRSDRAGLIGYWRFCGTFADSSGNRNDAVPSGPARISDLPDLPAFACCQSFTPPFPAILAPRTVLRCDEDSILLTIAPWTGRIGWSTGDTSRSIVVNRAGTYAVIVRDSNSCTFSTSIVITQAAIRPPAIIGQGVLCRDQSACLEVDTVYAAYRWSTGDTTRTICVSQPGVYVVEVMDAHGCTGSAALSLALSAAPLHIIGPTILCGQASATLTATAGYAGYRWSTGDTTLSIRIDEPGLYRVTARTKDGCLDTASIIVRQGMSSTTIVGDRVLCNDSTVLTITPACASYLWSTGQTTRSITVRFPGRYSIIVTDSLGCQADAFVDVVKGAPPAVSILGAHPLCDGDSLRLSVMGVYTAILWSTGATTQSIVVHKSGVYHVSVSKPGFCPGGTDTVSIEFGSKPTPSIIGMPLICAGDTAVFSVQAIPGHRWHWTSVSGNVIGAKNENMVRFQWTANGSDTVVVTETNDSTGCTDSARFAVTILIGPTVVITPLGPVTFCEGDSVLLDAGAGFNRYHWSDGSESRRIVVHSSGEYSVTVWGPAGCPSTSSPVTITVHPFPRIGIVGPRTLCPDKSAEYTVNGADDADIHWDVVAGSCMSRSDSANVMIQWRGPGTGIIRVSVTRGGCTSRDSMDVALSLAPVISIRAFPDTVRCEADSILLDADCTMSSYVWTDSAGVPIGSSRTIVVRRSGSYHLAVNDSTGCSGSDSISVRFIAGPRPTIFGPTEMCEGDTITLEGEAGVAAWFWSTGDTSRTIRIRSAGTYTLRVRDAHGCEGMSAPFVVRALPRPIPPLISCTDDTLRSTKADAYQWYFNGNLIPGATGSELIAQDSGRYAVVVRTGNGCTSSASIDWVAADLIVEIPRLEAAPGSRLAIPVMVRSTRQLASLGFTGFQASVRFLGGVFCADTAGVFSHLEGTDRVLSIRSDQPVIENPIAVIHGTAMLGSVETTPLHLDSFTFIGPYARITRIDGSLRILVCREGGVRLFDDGGILHLAQNAPNPFNLSTRIDYQLLEQGPVRLSAFDLLGREVVVLVDAECGAGPHTAYLDASALSSGPYILTLRTRSGVKTRMMMLEK